MLFTPIPNNDLEQGKKWQLKFSEIKVQKTGVLMMVID